MNPRGFTLVEVAVGLLLTSVVVWLGQVFVGDVVDRARALARAAEVRERRGRGLDWLRAAVGSLQVDQSEADSFDGASDRLQFSARLEQPGGWFEERRIELARLGDTLAAVVEHDTIAVLRPITAVQFQYLLSGGERAEWLEGWRSPATAPVVIRLIVWRDRVADSLLLRVGARA
jgi:hypothetical protein